MNDRTPTTPLVDFTCPCVRCAYDLIGIARDHRCPECGTPVRASNQGPTLDRSDPAWVRLVARGQRQLAWASTVTTLGGALFCLFATVLLFQGVSDWRAVNRIGVFTVGPCLIAGFVLLIAGGLKATALEPDAGPISRQGTACRALLWLALAFAGALAIATIIGRPSVRQSNAALALVDALLISLGVVAVLLVVQGSSFLARLAIRLPDAPMGARMIRCANITVVVASLGAGVAAVTSLDLFGFGLGMPYWSNPRDRIIIVGIGAIVASTLACACWWSLLMHRLARRLRYIHPRD